MAFKALNLVNELFKEHGKKVLVLRSLNPEAMHANHITIVVSGFLSGADNHNKTWDKLIRKDEVCYFLEWESGMLRELIAKIVKILGKITLDIALTLISGGSLGLQNLVFMGFQVNDLIKMF